jgi:hypothetical protein
MDELRFWPVIRFFVPDYRYGPPSRTMVWLERLRMASIAATYLVIVAYGTFTVADLLPLLQDHMIDTALGTPAFPVGMILLVAAAQPGGRRGLLGSFRVPLGRLAALIGGSLAVAFTLNWIMRIDNGNRGPYATLAVSLVKFATGAFAIAVIVPAAIVIGYLAVRHWCVAADGHPMLPAVITMFYASIQLALYFIEGGLPVLPPGLRMAVGIAGPVCLGLISAVELWLHRREGAPFRSLPPYIFVRIRIPR